MYDFHYGSMKQHYGSNIELKIRRSLAEVVCVPGDAVD